MPQMSIPYVLTGPDGTRCVFNDRSDPDFVGFLDPDQGIQGLLDSAPVRESADVKVEADGGVHGNFWSDRRSGTLQGMLLAESNTATVNGYESKLKRATRALRSDCTLDWTPDGSGARRLWLRRQQKVTITGLRPKQFLVGLVSARSYALSPTESSQVLTFSGTSGEAGFSSPISSPLTSVYNQTGQLYVVNQGDAPTWPRFVIQGPCTNPRIVNNTTGLQIQFVYTLGSTDTLTVDAEKATVLLNGSTDRYSAYQFLSSTWWQLLPGSNDVRVLAASYSAGAQITVYFRHAYE